MSNRNVTPVAILLITFFSILLCIVMSVAGFWLGRRSSSMAGGPDVVGEPPDIATTVDAARATEPVLPEGAAPDSVEGEPTPDAAPATAEAEDTTTNGSDEVELDVTESNGLQFDPDRETTFTEEDLALLWEVWELVEQEFDGELPPDEELTHAAIQGMLEALDDDYTRYTPPAAAELIRERMSGAFEGIGAFVQENELGLTEIVRPIDGQPADRAGLRAGDVVVGVDGESVVDRTLEEVIALIRGPEGTDVTLTIEREGLEEPFDVTITRARIEIPVIEAEMLEDNIAYIRLTEFNANATAQLVESLQELLAQNPRGLILDLRDNPGGLLDQSVAVADLFLPEGVVLFERSTTLGIDEEFRSDSGDLAEDIPLVVLVNAGSASASEIVAGAVRDLDRGVLIGETTFGKGSVQLTHTLSDGSELRVTIARWYTPANQSIDAVGIAPDIEVETPEDLGGEEDPQLQRAIEYILNGE